MSRGLTQSGSTEPNSQAVDLQTLSDVELESIAGGKLIHAPLPGRFQVKWLGKDRRSPIIGCGCHAPRRRSSSMSVGDLFESLLSRLLA